MSENPGNNERFEFVKEMLTGEELLERLAAAQDVVSGLTTRFFLAQDVIQSLREDIAKRDVLINDWQNFMQRISRNLARAGSYAHKEKNEQILQAIADLMTVSLQTPHFGSMDDIPF